MKALRIKSEVPHQFWCKKCKHESNSLYRVKGISYCELCLPKDIKQEDVYTVNQMREPIDNN